MAWTDPLRKQDMTKPMVFGAGHKGQTAALTPDEVIEPGAGPTLGNALALPKSSIDAGLSGAPEMYPSESPAASPMPSGAPAAGGGWFEQNKGGLISGLGLIGQAFAQTPGQLSAGRMATMMGEKMSDEQRKDAGAKLAGFQSPEHMAAEKTKQDMAESGSRIKLHEAEAMKAVKSIELIAAQAEKMGLDSKKLRRDIETSTPVEFDFGDGRKVLMEPEAGYKMKLDMMKTNAIIERYKSENKLTDAQAAQLLDLVSFDGLMVPAVKAAEWKTELQKAGIMAQASKDVATISAGWHYAAAAAAERAKEGKLDQESLKSTRKIGEEMDKILFDPMNSRTMFDTLPDGNMVIKPQFKQQMETYATTGAVLLRSPIPEDKVRGSFMINRALSVRGIKPEEYNMLMKGAVPGETQAAAPPSAAPSTTPGKALSTPLAPKVVMPPALAPKTDVPYGKTETALGEALPFAIPGYGLYKLYEKAGGALGRVYDDALEIQKINRGAK